MESSIHKVTILLIAALIIALGLVTTASIVKNNQTSITDGNATASEQARRDLLAIRDEDHVYGDPSAEVLIIKYSDAACQWCRWVYPQLLDLVDSFPTGDVALVYRYIPIYNTRTEVSTDEITGECVARQLGDDGFFAYNQALFASLPENQRLATVSVAQMNRAATQVGADANVLEQCVRNYTDHDRILTDHRSGGSLNIVTVPHTFIISKDEIWQISGAKSQTVYRSTVANLLTAQE